MGDVLGPKVTWGKVPEKTGVFDIKARPSFESFLKTDQIIDDMEFATSLFFRNCGFNVEDQISIAGQIISWGSGSNGQTYSLAIESKLQGSLILELLDFTHCGSRDLSDLMTKQFVIRKVDKSSDYTQTDETRFVYNGLHFKAIEMLNRSLIDDTNHVRTQYALQYQTHNISLMKEVGVDRIELSFSVPATPGTPAFWPTDYRLPNEQLVYEYWSKLQKPFNLDEIYFNITTIIGDEIAKFNNFGLKILQHKPPYSGTAEMTDQILIKDGLVYSYTETKDAVQVTVGEYGWQYKNNVLNLEIDDRGNYKFQSDGQTSRNRNVLKDYEMAKDAAEKVIVGTKKYDLKEKKVRERVK